MNRRSFLSQLAAAPLLRGAKTERPNIVYILADDLGWGDLRCYNPESEIAMPHANRLASEGVRFTDMHSPSSVCTPTRYGILTGRYCWRSRLKNGVLWGYSPNLIEPGRMTVASLLRARGYTTAGIGKWHLGLGADEKTNYSLPLRPCPVDHGFDYFFGIPASLDMEPYLYFENDRVVEQPSAHTRGQDTPRGVFYRPGPIAPHFKVEEVLATLAGKAVEYLRRRHEKPYFLYLPLTAPHTPWLPAAQYKGTSTAGIYGDFVSMTDDAIGRVLAAIDPTNTLVILTSDNGAHWTPEDRARFTHRANAHWRGQKADIHEAGHRVPFLVRWPGRLPGGTVNGRLACLTDLMATLAAITGAKLPASAGEDSFDLFASQNGREAVVHHSSQGMFAIREKNWKLILGRGSGGFTSPAFEKGASGGQLYDLSADPAESANLYAERPEVVERLTRLLEQYQRDGRSCPR
ncbi:MAG: arylsulfatase [Bryobacteraceae bacterium]|nr:arylsulfatase [Bryobacteraceae bacterium]